MVTLVKLGDTTCPYLMEVSFEEYNGTVAQESLFYQLTLQYLYAHWGMFLLCRNPKSL